MMTPMAHVWLVLMLVMQSFKFLMYFYFIRNVCLYHIFTVIFATDFDACIPADKIKELFASTLNRIAASVRCVSSVIVVLNAKLPD